MRYAVRRCNVTAYRLVQGNLSIFNVADVKDSRDFKYY